MAVVIDVPSNTTLANVDEALRTLVRRELDGHGIEGVDISFDAPSSEWSAKLTSPTVNLFLYDLREHAQQADTTPRDTRVEGAVLTLPPPLRLEMTYAVTAWAKAVEDEHRLLSQILAILFSHASLPADLLDGPLAAASRLREIETVVGRPKSEKAEFWTSIGGRYKASIDYAVLLEVESGAHFTRGPEVRTQTMRVKRLGGVVEELQRFAGTVSRAGAPVPEAWVALPDSGRWATSGEDGRFDFGAVRAGEHRVLLRTPAGEEASATAIVPGRGVDFELEE
jgi:Pvc16 N-terminal domain